ncbi:hypothetical protein Scep_006704 [Stephania cephalantha]|uniref:Cytochrome P450 n=1 Tax=Stephania cephalantha TaxID=152367 RepID=A0AAP0KB02_9MAGN
MQKAQKELDRVVGRYSKLEEFHIPKLHYLQVVMKEVLRLHLVLPFLLPHYPSSTCTIGGYVISKWARVYINFEHSLVRTNSFGQEIQNENSIIKQRLETTKSRLRVDRCRDVNRDSPRYACWHGTETKFLPTGRNCVYTLGLIETYLLNTIKYQQRMEHLRIRAMKHARPLSDLGAHSGLPTQESVASGSSNTKVSAV